MVKNLEREMFKSWGSFDTAIKLVKNAVTKKLLLTLSQLLSTSLMKILGFTKRKLSKRSVKLKKHLML